ncbi:hypothetical protein F2P81_001487 [Scophthalmus maximus]|uniref:Uncharacterized protein n=1 Tax=Scophthalmus maximus TaxID=52904 RepID=A0A6A4TKF5_SCOMX|nr:hypothetical protein F2P81_001487 [Scophthalmus maximus]
MTQEKWLTVSNMPSQFWDRSSNVGWYAATSVTLKLPDPLMTTPTGIFLFTNIVATCRLEDTPLVTPTLLACWLAAFEKRKLARKQRRRSEEVASASLSSDIQRFLEPADPRLTSLARRPQPGRLVAGVPFFVFREEVEDNSCEIYAHDDA